MDIITKERIERYLRDHNDVIRTGEFQRAGFHNSNLAILVEEGRIVRLKSGLYLSSEAQTESGFVEVQIALPNGVICLGSALAYHDFSTYEPPAVHVAIPRDDRTKPPDYPPTRRFSFGKERYVHGMIRVEIGGRHIAIYDREKTLCDAISFRRVLGQDVVNEALRTYLTSAGTNIDRLIEYSRMMRVEGPVLHHLKVLA